MEVTIIKTISEFGGIGLAAFLSYILYRIISNHLVHLTSSIDKNTETLCKLELAIGKLVELLELKLK